MNTPIPAVPEVPCVRCGHQNPRDASRCGECGAPRDDIASAEPKETGSAMGPACKDPDPPRTKPIVFWGVWIYFGPTAVGSGVLAYTTLAPILSGSPGGQEVAGAIAIVVMCGLYGVSSCWALWSVTSGCFKRR